jgi:hypothetical protein
MNRGSPLFSIPALDFCGSTAFFSEARKQNGNALSENFLSNPEGFF